VGTSACTSLIDEPFIGPPWSTTVPRNRVQHSLHNDQENNSPLLLPTYQGLQHPITTRTCPNMKNQKAFLVPPALLLAPGFLSFTIPPSPSISKGGKDLRPRIKWAIFRTCPIDGLEGIPSPRKDEGLQMVKPCTLCWLERSEYLIFSQSQPFPAGRAPSTS